VRELFEKEAPRTLRRTRHQLYAHINADYYGFRDEEDGLLERVEAAAEGQLRQQARRARPCEGPVAMQSPPRARRLSAGLQSGKELAVRQAWYTLPVRRPQPNLFVTFCLGKK